MPDNNGQLTTQDIYAWTQTNPDNKKTFSEFQAKLQNPDYRVKLFNALHNSDKKDSIPENYDDFEVHLGVKKKDISGSQPTTSSKESQGGSTPSQIFSPLDITRSFISSSLDAAKVKSAQDRVKEAQTAVYGTVQPSTQEDNDILSQHMALNTVHTQFSSNPKYLNPQERENYYNSLPANVRTQAKNEGEKAAKTQEYYNYVSKKVAENPTPETLGELAQLQYDAGDVTKATKTYQHVLNTYPDSPEGALGMAGLLYDQSKQFPKQRNELLKGAIDNVTVALSKNPNNPNTLNLYAQILMQTGKENDAIDVINKSVDKAENGTKEKAEAYYIRSAFRTRLNNTLGAARDRELGQVNADIVKERLNVQAEEHPQVAETIGGIPKPIDPDEQVKREAYDNWLNNLQNEPMGFSDAIHHPMRFAAKTLLNVSQQASGGFMKSVESVSDIGKIAFDPNTYKDKDGKLKTIGGATIDVTKRISSDLMNTVAGVAESAGGIGQMIDPALGLGFNAALGQMQKTPLLGTDKYNIDAAKLFGDPYGYVNEKITGHAPESELGKGAQQMVDLGVNVATIGLLHKAGVVGTAKIADFAKSEMTSATNPEYGDPKYFNDLQKSNDAKDSYEQENVEKQKLYEQSKIVPSTEMDAHLVDLQNKAEQLAVNGFKEAKVRYGVQILGQEGVVKKGQLNRIQDAILNNRPITYNDQIALQEGIKKLGTTKGVESALEVLPENVLGVGLTTRISKYIEQKKLLYGERPTEKKADVTSPVNVETDVDDNPKTITINERPDKLISLDKALKEEPANPRQAALQYFLSGGRINSADWSRATMLDENTSEYKGALAREYTVAKISEESKQYNVKQGIHAPNAPTADIIAKEHLPQMMGLDEISQEKEGDNVAAINDVLSDHQNRESMAAELRESKTPKEYGVDKQIYTIDKKGKSYTFRDNFGDKVTGEKHQELLKHLKENMPKDEPKSITIRQRVVPAMNSVLPFHVDTSPDFGDWEEAKRQGHYYTPEGERIDRNKKIQTILGKEYKGDEGAEYEVGKKVDYKYALVDPAKLEAQHVNGIPNLRNFNNQAMPYNRYMQINPTDILDPEQVGHSNTVYDGAPMVNELGETIQGNGRTNILKDYDYQTDPHEYYDHLKSIADQTGIDEKTIDANRGKVLVRISKMKDADVMSLGGKTEGDLVETTPQTVSANRLLNINPEQAQDLHNFVNGDLDNAMWTKGQDLVNKLVNAGIIDRFDAPKMLSGDQINEWGYKALNDLFNHTLGNGAHSEWIDDFKTLRDEQQKSLKNSLFNLISLGEDAPMEHIQNAVTLLADKGRIGESFLGLHPATEAFKNYIGGLDTQSGFNDIIDTYKNTLKGDETIGVPPMTKEEAIGYLWGNEPTITKSINYENQLNDYTREKPTEARETQTINPRKADDNNGDTQGKTVDLDVKQTPVSTDIGEVLGDDFLGGVGKVPLKDQNNIIKNGFDGTGLIAKNGVGVSRFWNKVKNHYEPMSIVHLVDDMRDKMSGSNSALDKELGGAMKKFNKAYPEIANYKGWHPDLIKTWDFLNNGGREAPQDWTPQQKAVLGFTMKLWDKAGDLMQDVRNRTPEFIEQEQVDIFINKEKFHRDIVDFGGLDRGAYEEQSKIEAENIKASTGQITGFKYLLNKIIGNKANDIMKDIPMAVKSVISFFGNKADTSVKNLLEGRTMKIATDEQGKRIAIHLKSDGSIETFDKDGKPMEIARSASIKDNQFEGDDKKVYKVEDGEPKELMQLAPGIEYNKNPIEIGMIMLKAANDLYNHTLLLKAMKENPKMDGKIFFLNDAQKALEARVQSPTMGGFNLTDEESKAIQKFRDKKPLTGEEKANVEKAKAKEDEMNSEMARVGLQGTRFDDKDLNNKLVKLSGFPKAYENVRMRGKYVAPFARSLAMKPIDYATVNKAFLNVWMYENILLGSPLRHAYNILENSVLDNLHVDQAKAMFGDIKDWSAMKEAWKSVNNPASQLALAFERSGVPTMYLKEDTYDQLITGLTKQKMAEGKSFQRDLGIGQKKDFSAVDVAHGVGTVLGAVNKVMTRVKNETTWRWNDFNNRYQILQELKLSGLSPDEIDFNNEDHAKLFNQAVATTLPRLNTYKVGSHILFGANKAGYLAASLLRNKNLLVFAGYDYGNYKLLFNDVRALGKGGIGKTPLENRMARMAAQRLALRLTYVGYHQRIEDELNKSKNPEKYAKLPYLGDLNQTEKMVGIVKGASNALFGTHYQDTKSVTDLLNVSPFLDDAVSLKRNADDFGNPIYNADDGWMRKTKDAASWMFQGGNIFKWAEGVPTGTEDKHQLLSAFLPVNFSNLSPSETSVYLQLKNYRDNYINHNGFITKAQSKYEQDFKAGKKDALNEDMAEWYNRVRQATGNMLIADQKATEAKIEQLQVGAVTPKDLKIPENERLDYWTKHLEQVNTFLKAFNEDMEKSAKDKHEEHNVRTMRLFMENSERLLQNEGKIKKS